MTIMIHVAKLDNIGLTISVAVSQVHCNVLNVDESSCVIISFSTQMEHIESFLIGWNANV